MKMVSQRCIKKLILALFVSLGIGIVYFYIESSLNRKHIGVILQEIGALKSKTVQLWAQERMGDCRILGEGEIFGHKVQDFLDETDNSEIEDALLSHMRLITSVYDFSSIMLCDLSGRPLLSTDPGMTLPAQSAAAFQRCVSASQVGNSSFQVSSSGEAYIDWLAPVYEPKSQKAALIAVAILRNRPKEFFAAEVSALSSSYKTLHANLIYPTLSAFDVLLSPSSDLSHFVKDGGSLNLTLFDPSYLRQVDKPRFGIEMDNQGQKVVYCLHPIHDSEWKILVEIDYEEIIFPVLLQSISFAAVSFFSLVILILVLRKLEIQKREIQGLELEKQKFVAHQQIQNLSNNIPRGFVLRFELNPQQGNFIHYVSQGVKRVFGLEPDQILANNALLLGHLDRKWAAGFRSRLVQSARKMSEISEEIAVDLAGETIWVTLNAQPSKLENGLIVWDGVAVDTTEQKRIQSQLEASEEQFRRLFHDSRQPMLIFRDGLFTEVNQAAVQILGMDSAQELLLTSPEDISPERQPDGKLSSEKVKEVVSEAIRLGGHAFEWEHIKKDGSAFRVLVTATSLSRGNYHFLYVTWNDITKRIEAEEKLHESEARFRSFFLDSMQPMFLFQDGTINQANKAAAHLLGFDSVEELIRVPPERLCPTMQPDGQPSGELLCHHFGVALKNGSHTADLVYIRADGEHLFLRTMFTPFQFGSRSVVHLSCTDITEQKQRQTLDELQLKVLSMMAGEASLNQILHSIIELLEFRHKDWHGSIMLVDDSGQNLNCAAAPKLPGFFVKAMVNIPIRDILGACPVAVSKRQAVFTDDITMDPHWLPFRDLCLRTPLRSCWSFPIVDANHQVLGAMAVFRTVPSLPNEEAIRSIEQVQDLASLAIEHSRRQAKLEQSEERFRKLFKDSTQPLIIIENQLIIDANHSAIRLFGVHQLTELVKRNPVEFSPAFQPDGRNSAESVREIFDEVARSGSLLVEEWQHVRQDGSTFIAEMLLTAIRFDDRMVIYAAMTDITQRKQMQSELKQYEVIVNSTDEAIISSNLDETITSWNNGATRTFGYSADEMIGRSVGTLFTKTHRERRSQMLGKIQETTKRSSSNISCVYQIEYDCICKNGHHISVSASISPIYDDRSNIKGIVEIYRDISQQKKIQVELEKHRNHLERLIKVRTQQFEDAKRQAESANRAKTYFLANMSHEIRTPLNAIIGFAYLVSNRIEEPALKERINKIIDSSNHLLAIISDILDLSKIESEALKLDPTTFLIHTLLDNVHNMMHAPALEKGLELRLEYDDRLEHLAIEGDQLRLRQVVINYVSNAIKFTSEGHIIIRAKVEDLSDQAVSLRLEVQDTGIGISSAQKARLFQPFSQAESSTTRKFGGTGLGLAICRRLAQLMGGIADVESEPGRGSTFFITAKFKIGQSKDLSQRKKQINGRIGRGARVLLVEDNPINQEVVKEILEELHMNVEVANHGQEACEMVEANPYDIILMDIQMPVMDGLEATRMIRKMPTGKEIPIIAMTANVLREDRGRCEAAGMSGFLSKPVDPYRLSTTLSTWIPAPETETVTERMPFVDIQLQSRLNEVNWKHISLKEGLKYVQSWPTYHRLLKNFESSHLDFPERILDSLKAKNRKAAELEVHTVKGISASLGMRKLHQLAKVLEDLLKKEADRHILENAVAPFTIELKAVIDEIQSIPLPQAPEADAMNLIEVQEKIGEFLSLLEQDDVKAHVLWKEIQSALSVLVDQESFHELRRKIEGFNFPDAAITLRAIMQEAPLLNSGESQKPKKE